MNGTLQGEGTRENPYLIEDADDFYAFMNMKSYDAETGNYVSFYAKQTQDIDFNDKYVNGAKSISNTKSSSNVLIYDGCHYKLKNIKLLNKSYFISIAGQLLLYNIEIVNLEVISPTYSFELISHPSSYSSYIVMTNSYIHGKIVCSYINGLLCGYWSNNTSLANTMIGCLIELNIEINHSSSVSYILTRSTSNSAATICDNIVRCKIVSASRSDNTKINTVAYNEMAHRCLIDNEYIGFIDTSIGYVGTNRTANLGTNIVNHTKGGVSDLQFDSINLLTEEQTKDLSYYEALGWWV